MFFTWYSRLWNHLLTLVTWVGKTLIAPLIRKFLKSVSGIWIGANKPVQRTYKIGPLTASNIVLKNLTDRQMDKQLTRGCRDIQLVINDRRNYNELDTFQTELIATLTEIIPPFCLDSTHTISSNSLSNHDLYAWDQKVRKYNRIQK